MKNTISLIAAGALLIAVAGPASAHHAVNAQFDVNKTVTMKGVLTKIDWINPHAYFHYDVKAADGSVQQWAFESPGPNALRRIGLSNKTLWKLGDTYTIVTNPARNGARLGTLGIVTFPDGRKINISATDPNSGIKN